MNTFEEISRPVIFEHQDATFPYWGKGSSMLLANSQHYFWVTASHIFKNMDGAVENLLIFPSDDSRVSLPFNEKYHIKAEASDDEDYLDILALRIDLARFDAFGDVPLVAQDIDVGLLPAEDLKAGDVLWIIGYPAERNTIDYEKACIRNSRDVIRAIYQGTSLSEHCHKAKVNSSVKLDSYDGLSGSPIFYLQPVTQNGQKFVFPRVVGMLLRGTAYSNLVHFVSAKVIGELIRLASHGDS